MDVINIILILVIVVLALVFWFYYRESEKEYKKVVDIYKTLNEQYNNKAQEYEVIKHYARTYSNNIQGLEEVIQKIENK